VRPKDVQTLAEQLRSEIEVVLPGSTMQEEPKGSIAGDIRYVERLSDGRIGVVARLDDKVFIELTCVPRQPTTPKTVSFLRHLVRLFSSDLRVVDTLLRDHEIWLALSQSRFPRAVARASTFSTSTLVSWLNSLEAAGRQTYERQPFAGSVVFTTQLHWITDRAGDAFLRFDEQMTLEHALLSEKWTRPLLGSGALALVGVSHTGMIRGLLAYGDMGDGGTIAPHHRLTGLYQYLVPGTTLLFSSGHGDTFVSLPDGPTFAKSQGRWHYRDHDAALGILGNHLPPELAARVLQLVLDLSFDRTGALFVFVGKKTSIADLVPDHELPGRVSESLRRNVAGLSLDSFHHRQVIASAARADGAVVLDQAGVVLDAACMITEPSEALRKNQGIESLRRFSGARTTAAWNASISGVAIKVSEDGPIEVFEAGESVWRMG
jgi:hypothetical protein